MFILSTHAPLVNIILKAVSSASKVLVRDFGEVGFLQSSEKGLGSFVAKTDKRAESAIYRVLKEHFPRHNFLMEEAGRIEASPGLESWLIVDPLDGSSNFFRGIPHFAISVAVQEAGELVAAVVYDPLKNEVFWAHKGMGAFLNRTRLRLNSPKLSCQPMFSMNLRRDQDSELKALRRIEAKVRSFGVTSLALAYVAAGRFDGVLEWNPNPWDVAAGMLLVKEAGGQVSHKAPFEKKNAFMAGSIPGYILLSQALRTV